jgi:hypothetical protein
MLVAMNSLPINIKSPSTRLVWVTGKTLWAEPEFISAASPLIDGLKTTRLKPSQVILSVLGDV